ncbi:nucleoside hydrolase [Halalkalicoccus jeotgali]|uniref:Inosine/uridine-preferring nucleoside hydrolase n=1 Tax=Halalkalicoccus jeotgali (strain DSM 18796 / CECT 7217 / JCM 14584 / KCTC 4019 / B3) TaxID=795797 RepID=D8J4K8_HALJB|nr:nucleoside hydrolase [Halalkalicoccus jeotgali]ADJ13570.1 Inosine/uridine-preferring nucleoside hydrolase [Halalkalicoccus jeotgali B3]ELY33134.1 Inosine/uridine-preferring nucleoside hydrolase [Halalkalicoccus jeotgali B3]
MSLLIDTDPGCDDALALLLALESDLDVVGLTTVAGNSTITNTTRNTLALLDFFDSDLPVARGAGRPLVKRQDTAEFIHGEGGLKGDLPAPTREPVDISGAEFIVEKACEDGDLTIAAIGPLTNLALALGIEPDLPELLDDVLVMGGAVYAPGNRTPAAEANLHADPDAASRVLQSLDPTFVGLGVTMRATLDPATLDRSGRRGAIVEEWLTYYPDDVRERYGIDRSPIHDAAVIAHLTDGVLTLEDRALEIDTREGPCRGALLSDEYGVTEEPENGRVATDIDAERFRETMGEAIESVL